MSDVHTPEAATAALFRLALLQGGAFTREQARGLGESDRVLTRMVRQATVQRVARGVYCWGLPDDSLRQRAWVAHLTAGPATAIGGRAALVLADASSTEPPNLLVWAPTSGLRPRVTGVTLREDSAGRLRHRRGTLPRIRVEDALLDAAEESFDEFVGLTTEALRRHRTSPPTLRKALAERSRIPHRRLVDAFLADLDGLESPLEYLYQRDVERRHGLPAS